MPGALNLYARYPLAFGVIDRGRGLLLAAMAGLAYSTALTHEEDERREANLHAALATREIIGQAQGILMEREHLTSVQAFDILRRASQHLNRKLRDVAQNLVDTGERPDTGPRPGLKPTGPRLRVSRHAFLPTAAPIASCDMTDISGGGTVPDPTGPRRFAAFDASYEETPPWDIGHAQPAFAALAESGR